MKFALTFGLGLAFFGCGSPSVDVVMNEQNGSGQSGHAQLSEKSGGLEVRVTIRRGDLPSDRLYPTHFHNGRCGEISGLLTNLPAPQETRSIVLDSVRDPAMYNEVTDGGVLLSLTQLKNVKIKDVSGGDWVINVHDPRDTSLYVACGDLP